MKIERKKQKTVVTCQRTWEKRWQVKLPDKSVLSYLYTNKGGHYDLCLGARDGLAFRLVLSFAECGPSGRTYRPITPAPRGMTCLRTRQGREVASILRKPPKWLATYKAEPGRVFPEHPRKDRAKEWADATIVLANTLALLCECHGIARTWWPYDVACFIRDNADKGHARLETYGDTKETLLTGWADVIGRPYYFYMGEARQATEEETQYLIPGCMRVTIAPKQ